MKIHYIFYRRKSVVSISLSVKVFLSMTSAPNYNIYLKRLTGNKPKWKKIRRWEHQIRRKGTENWERFNQIWFPRSPSSSNLITPNKARRPGRNMQRSYDRRPIIRHHPRPSRISYPPKTKRGSPFYRWP